MGEIMEQSEVCRICLYATFTVKGLYCEKRGVYPRSLKKKCKGKRINETDAR